MLKAILLWLLMAGLISATGRRTPLSAVAESLQKEGEEFLERPTHYAFNFGLSGAVTQEDWDRATIKGVDPPVLVHPNLNNNTDPVTITGMTMSSIKNRTIYGFQGIRFGKPPVEDLRFKKTEPAEPYFEPENTLLANHLGEKCPQQAMFGPVGAGDEDCLFLNVYTPYMPEDLPDNKTLPVMMFIHGGAFISGDSSLYLPTRLLDHDVILVTIHYRLGSLGFFSLQNGDAPGNAGLWDQIEAMKWIQNYIYGFGGDSEKVTIFGESAGSASVNYHVVLPEAKGLFRGVIGESGSALEHWALDPEPMVSAKLVAGKNGCDNSTAEAMYECMKRLPHEQLSVIMHEFVSEDRKRGEMGFRGAAPVIDDFESIDEPLVIKYPEQYYEDGDVNDVPLLLGCNKHEGSFVLGIMYTAYLEPHQYQNDSYYLKNYVLSDLLNAFGVIDQTNGIGESLEDSYMGGVDMTDFIEDTPGLIDMAGVFFLKAGGWMTAKLHAKHTTQNTYFYSFDYESDDTMFNWLFIGYDDIPFEPGVTHADEMMYIFAFPAVLEGHQLVVKDRLVAMWTNFAIYGDPTPSANPETWKPLGIPEWRPVTDTQHPYMLIQEECTLEEEYPDRWHITLQERGGGGDTTLGTDTTSPGTVTISNGTDDTTDPGTVTTSPVISTTPIIHGDYDQIKQERQAFMISMIVFIVVSVVMGAAAVFFFFRSRGFSV